MREQWKLISEWNNLSPEKKLTATLAIIIFSLVTVILYYESKLNRIESAYKKDLKEKEKENEAVLKNHILYMQKSEREYRDIVLDIRKLKER